MSCGSAEKYSCVASGHKVPRHWCKYGPSCPGTFFLSYSVCQVTTLFNPKRSKRREAKGNIIIKLHWFREAEIHL